jgi:hypothetical protein
MQARYGRMVLYDPCGFNLCYTLRQSGSKIPARPRREGTMVGVSEINSTRPLALSSRGLRMTLILL